MSGGGAGDKVVGQRGEKTVFMRPLLKQTQRLVGQPHVESGIDERQGIVGKDAPDTGQAGRLALRTSPQKALRGRVFRAQEFDASLTDDSDKGLQHA